MTAAHDAVLELTRETEAREGELAFSRGNQPHGKDACPRSGGREARPEWPRSTRKLAKNERDALANRTRIIGLTRELGQKEEALQNAQEEARQAEWKSLRRTRALLSTR